MIRPLDKTHELDSFLRYIGVRLVLKEELERLERDEAWRGLMATSVADQARKQWNVARLLDYKYTTWSEINGQQSVEPKQAPPQAKTASPPVRKVAPAAPTNLRITSTMRIEPLHRMAEALPELGNRDVLTLARRYSPSADRAIYGWLMVCYRVNPLIQFTNESIWNLTLPQLTEVGNYEPPTVSQAEILMKEQTSITLPSLGLPIGLLQSTSLVELGTLFSLFHFWLYYRGARHSPSFPPGGTLFGEFARTRFTRLVFLVFVAIPPSLAAVLASKSLWFTYANAVIAALIILVAVLIAACGPLPAAVHDDVDDAADENGPAVG